MTALHPAATWDVNGRWCHRPTGTPGRSLVILEDDDDAVEEPSIKQHLRMDRPQAFEDFPMTLPHLVLTKEEQSAPYGLQKGGGRTDLPLALQKEIRLFERWSTEPVQLTRTEPYSAPVQSTTLVSQEHAISAYLGYVVNIAKVVRREDAGLQEWSRPYLFIGFIMFLILRDVGKGYLLKNISLAKKINAYLRARGGEAIDTGGSID